MRAVLLAMGKMSLLASLEQPGLAVATSPIYTLNRLLRQY